MFVFIFKMIHGDTMGVKFHFNKKEIFTCIPFQDYVIKELKILQE